LDQNQDKNKSYKSLSSTSFGLNLAVGMVFFTLIGLYVDNEMGSGFLGLLCGIFLGLLYCTYEIWKLIKNQENNDSKK